MAPDPYTTLPNDVMCGTGSLESVSNMDYLSSTVTSLTFLNVTSFALASVLLVGESSF